MHWSQSSQKGTSDSFDAPIAPVPPNLFVENNNHNNRLLGHNKPFTSLKVVKTSLHAHPGQENQNPFASGHSFIDRSQLRLEMVPTKSRSRSNTAASAPSRKRAQSRASTTSIHSVATQSALDQQIVDHATDFKTQLYDHDPNVQQPNQAYPDLDHSLTPDDMMRHPSVDAHRQLAEMDPSLGAMSHMSYSQHGLPYKLTNERHSLPMDNFGAGFGDDDSQILETRSDEQDEIDSLAGQAKKPARSSAANEKEMRHLYSTNKHRTLTDVATELHGNERGPQSERTRQVFAMLWISQVCHKGKGSVPRGRVYANYVSRCATERVTVLNPASFGKLVRVLFPGLKTRRLGVRGESKYHYVNFSLTEDHADVNGSQGSGTQQAQAPSDQPRFSASASINSRVPADRAMFPSPNPRRNSRRDSQRAPGMIQPFGLYSQPDLRSVMDLDSTAGKVSLKLQFPPANDTSMQEYEAIALPKIDPYIPAGTDVDSASTLTALYRSHCTSLIECIRFCKEKTFFHLFTSFHGTLTMPVQKLFANPSIAPWIEECDFVMYQRMMRVVAPLTLQVAPKPVLDTLRNIAERLVLHIQDSFQGQPQHVIEAKIAPATLFAALLDRELRVNLTAHAAANMLSNPANRDQMYEDWITMVRTRKVAECVPSRAMDDVVYLLLTELRELLNPVEVPWDIEGQTAYGEMALRTGRQQPNNMHSDGSTENVLDRWVAFLTKLPSRFPYATHAEIVWAVERVGTAVMRDLTIQQGKSFGAWWVTKCWIDEMIQFMAEQGGFMAYKSSRRSSSEIPERQGSNAASQYSTASDDFQSKSQGHGNSHSGDGGASLPRPMNAASQNAMNAAAGNEDSGMLRSDDDFGMGKFGYVDDSLVDHSHDAALQQAAV